jgi:hypothetical protein
MKSHTGSGDSPDLSLCLPLLIAAVVFPRDAYAIQVGCFFTAIFVGIMFLFGLGITVLLKHFLARYVWEIPKTPWTRMFALTWLELLLIILVFALVRTNFFYTLLIYLPFGIFVNSLLLARVSGTAVKPATVLKQYAVFSLLALALPVSIQIAGALGSALTKMITFTELRM